MPQDHRIQKTIDLAIEAGVSLIPVPEGMKAQIELGIAYAVRFALKELGIETGKIVVEAGEDAKISVSVER